MVQERFHRGVIISARVCTYGEAGSSVPKIRQIMHMFGSNRVIRT